MVDLVKVRKKAKQKAENRPRASGLGPREPEAQAEPKAEAKPAAKTVPPPAPPRAPAPPAAPESRIPNPESRATPAAESKLERFLATAGQRRNVEKVKAAAAGDHLELLTFYLAGELYAIDIETVVEIITPRPITRIPNADPSVVGILSLRGTVVTLIDVRRRLGHGSAEAEGEDVRVVVVQQQGDYVGFIVDRVLRVVKAESESIEPHPVVHASEQDASVRGVFRQADALTILLDLEKLVSRD